MGSPSWVRWRPSLVARGLQVQSLPLRPLFQSLTRSDVPTPQRNAQRNAMVRSGLGGTKEEHKCVPPTGAKAMAVKATWHVKLTRCDHARTALTNYLNCVPKNETIAS